MKSKKTPTQNGFTMVEVLLATLFLVLLATSVAGVYSSGHQSFEEQSDRILLGSQLRSRMELLVGTDFSTLTGGSSGVTVNGKSYTITWTVVNVDLDSDGLTEPDAKKVTVFLSGQTNRSLTTLRADPGAKLGKIS